jgi:hypothetical protein
MKLNPSKDKNALFAADDSVLHVTGVIVFSRQLFTPDKPESVAGPEKFGATVLVPHKLNANAPSVFGKLATANPLPAYMADLAKETHAFLAAEKSPKATNPDSLFYKGKLPTGKQSFCRSVPDDHPLSAYGQWAKVVAKTLPAKCHGGELKFLGKDNKPITTEEAKRLIVDGAFVTLSAGILVSVDRENVSAQILAVRFERGPIPETEGLGVGRDVAPPPELAGLDEEYSGGGFLD